MDSENKMSFSAPQRGFPSVGRLPIRSLSEGTSGSHVVIGATPNPLKFSKRCGTMPVIASPDKLYGHCELP